MKPTISIIIINYNTKELLKSLFLSILKSKAKDLVIEIIIVDNNSTDGSQEQIKKFAALIKKKNISLKAIINKKNLGYAKANNQAIRVAKGRYILFLNSDTKLLADTLIKMVKFMDLNKQASAATCRVELADGSLDFSCHRGFPTPWAAFSYFVGLEGLFFKLKLFSQYHQGWKDFNQIHQVDVISGAFFLIRKEVLAKIGFFDEKFFIYGEDIDLCYRMNKKGYKIYFYPKTKIIHYKKQSGREKNKNKIDTQNNLNIRETTKKYFYQTMKIFYQKHYQNKYPWIVTKLVLFGIWLASKLKG